jgi:hypothetical protein
MLLGASWSFLELLGASWSFLELLGASWTLLAAAAPPALTQGADCQDAEGLRGVISNYVVTSLTVGAPELISQHCSARGDERPSTCASIPVARPALKFAPKEADRGTLGILVESGQ